MKRKNPLAVALGRLGKGAPRKPLTAAELARRTARLEAARAKRWPKKGTK